MKKNFVQKKRRYLQFRWFTRTEKHHTQHQHRQYTIEKNDDGDYDTADYYTTEEVYNNCKVGDMFSYDEDRDSEEEPVEKSKAKSSNRRK